MRKPVKVVTIHSPSKNTVYYTDGEQQVLDMFISDNTIDRQDIENTLDISQSMAVKHLSRLLGKTAIEKLGSGKNIHYKLR